MSLAEPGATPQPGARLPSVSDAVLLFLAVDAVALLIAGGLPASVRRRLTPCLGGIGLLVCLAALVLANGAATLSLMVGPPGLGLQVELDPLGLFFLLLVLLSGTAIAAVEALSPVGSPGGGAAVGDTALGIGGAVIAILAADGVTLALGLAAIGRGVPRVVAGGLMLTAVCLLTPQDYAPLFDAIRMAPVDADHATAAVALALAAMIALLRPWGGGRGQISTLGLLIPLGVYLLLRTTDLCAGAMQSWWGAVLVMGGGAIAVVAGWRAAVHPGIDAAVGALMRRQAGLAVAGIGLVLVARAADLPAAASTALQATCLTAFTASLAGTLAGLAAEAVAAGAGTARLSSLGDLGRLMPATAAALAAALLALSALPPSLGFTSLWLSFQSILSAPRTGGLATQLPLALIAAGLALSAAVATAASVRVVGIAILGRPRTPLGAGAGEGRSLVRTVMLGMAAVSVLGGLLPGSLLWVLAEPAIDALAGSATAAPSLLPASGFYPMLSLVALVGVATVGVVMVGRRKAGVAKPAGVWTGGLTPPVGLPFGEPNAQSAGEGFLPVLPAVGWSALRLPGTRVARVRGLGVRAPGTGLAGTGLAGTGLAGAGLGGTGLAGMRFAGMLGRWLAVKPRAPTSSVGIWLILVGFTLLLLVLTALS